MDQPQVEAFIESLENVQREEAYGYLFFFVGADHRLPFTTIAQADYDYDNVSNLSREGVFRINIGVGKATFDSLFDSTETADIDFTVLNTFLPHPDYAKQHFICILNPDGENEARTQKFITEAHAIAAERLQHQAKP